ncbi:hypothetical protein Y1Q_0015725 [Alligator mississippiensis]|uniref:VWFD domain-containing protein n=1 Tax=Alligator mississippiensis TaxID=8496 RepID=A0A151NLW7_ALLMI|nr:hypothetical protein Y1Q_0015725 [Alligator mississippiensis]
MVLGLCRQLHSTWKDQGSGDSLCLLCTEEIASLRWEQSLQAHPLLTLHPVFRARGPGVMTLPSLQLQAMALGMRMLLLVLFWAGLVPCAGSVPSPMGKQFLTAFPEMQCSQSPRARVSLQLLVTGFAPSTTVTVIVKGMAFQKVLTLHQGETQTVELPDSTEMVGTGFFDRTVVVVADHMVYVLSVSSKDQSSESTVLYPMESLGQKYYVVTPTSEEKAPDSWLQFTVVAGPEGTTVEIHPKGPVKIYGTTYNSWNTVNIDLLPYKAIQLQSQADLSGSVVLSSRPVAVLSGHGCVKSGNTQSHVIEQLLPVSSWGFSFILPPLGSSEAKLNQVYVAASQPTAITHWSGKVPGTQNVAAGEVAKLAVGGSTALSITANASVQVLYCSLGGMKDHVTFSPFLTNVPPITSFCSSFRSTGLAGFTNYVALVAKTKDVWAITLDKGLLGSTRWHTIQESDYLWGTYSLGRDFSSHSIEHPSAAFGILSFGITQLDSYGSVGICTDAFQKPSCDTVQCRKKEKCQVVNGAAVCVAESTASCSLSGDPHYQTFDGHYYDFMGTCTYTIVKTCTADRALPAFTVEVKNENRGNPHVSYVGYVTVRVYNFTISAVRYETGFVRVNNQRSRLPITLHNGKLRAYQSGTSLFIKTDFSLIVYFDWNSFLGVKLSSSFAESVCGLCGNFNGDPQDDFATPAGVLAPDPVEFGKSWKVPDGDWFCWDDCHGPCKSCPPDVAAKYQAESFCSWLMQGVGGPFSQCHAVIDPLSYLKNCVYDLCMTDGSQESLCQALKSYAEECQAAGITVTDWRTPAGCSNSQYKLCGSACPTTCNDQAAPTKCSLPCVETCECQDGFVLDAGQCIPQAGCGCEFEGRLYGPGEQFWGDDACSRHCVCDPQTRRVNCQQETCRRGEQCRVEKGIQGCYPANYSTCTSLGDPHYTSFDGHRFDFQGSCLYQLVGLCQDSGDLVGFQVLVQNDNRGLMSVSFTKAVVVRVYGVNITISREHPGRVLVNGLLTNLPYSIEGAKLIMVRKGPEAAIQTDFGLTVTFDWQSRVTVTMPSTYASTVCGLCGNFNGDKADDQAMKDGRATMNPIAFGQSWKVAETPGCMEPSEPVCSPRAAMERKQRREKVDCGLILADNGPFRACHAKVKPEGYFQDCVYDYCFFRGRMGPMCQMIASYAAACQAAGAAVSAWRSEQFCSPSCPRHSHYELCGSSCPATCHSLPAAAMCAGPCTEGCFCDAGFVLSGDQCVPAGQCGCLHEGRYYSHGQEFFIGTTCQQWCRCEGGGAVVCRPAPCGAGEECRMERGTLGCYSVRHSECTMAGSSHYLTFDGRTFDFQGSCTYTLARVCYGNARLGNFSVVVQNQSPGDGRVALVGSVLVSVQGYTVIMEQGRRWTVTVDGELHTLPLVSDNNELWANQEGNNIIVQTASGLRVLYDTSSYVLVTVPGTYQGHMCGLCGNFNDDKSDDLLLPDGTSARSVDEFGASWKVPSDGAACIDGCGERCPMCDDARTAPYRAEGSCGLIQAASGPFSHCHALVSPAAYFGYCLYDLCAADGARETLCRSLQAYAAACQAAGAQIGTWRSTSFCPLSCPSRSDYNLCTHSCRLTCASLVSLPPCTGKCFEGCQCEAGTLFDGEKCMLPEGCGCFHGRRYIQSLDTVLSANCSEACTCTNRAILLCESMACALGETCAMENGVRACRKGATLAP